MQRCTHKQILSEHMYHQVQMLDGNFIGHASGHSSTRISYYYTSCCKHLNHHSPVYIFSHIVINFPGLFPPWPVGKSITVTLRCCQASSTTYRLFIKVTLLPSSSIILWCISCKEHPALLMTTLHAHFILKHLL